MTSESSEFLRKFIEGGSTDSTSLCWKVVERISAVNRDVDDLKRRRSRVEVEITRISGLDARGESDEKELQELTLEKAALAVCSPALIRAIRCSF